ncbi:hypothetical protein C0J52_14059 [Blattella germanica]|nr:hypothetical protein C0J52_14059 [Blattella germanica]
MKPDATGFSNWEPGYKRMGNSNLRFEHWRMHGKLVVNYPMNMLEDITSNTDVSNKNMNKSVLNSY